MSENTTFSVGLRDMARYEDIAVACCSDDGGDEGMKRNRRGSLGAQTQ